MGRKPSDVQWVGVKRICSEKLEHYDAFSTTDIGTGSRITIDVHSFVFIKSTDKYRDNVAYVQDLYEKETGCGTKKMAKKMARVRWFNFTDETTLPESEEIHPNEILITSYEQDTNIECINGVAIVLTQNHFEEWLKLFPEDYGSQNFLCYRECKDPLPPAPFALEELHGYGKQHALTVLTESKRIREQGHFDVNDDVEILSQDSGMRGCWFKVKILESLPEHFKVLHYDVLAVNGPEKLEEFVPRQKVADADEYGMRCPGRLTMRPWPLRDDPSGYSLEVGGAVDVWNSDGWWECVIISFLPKHDKIRVFSPGEQKFMNVRRTHIRVSRDWVRGEWVSIEPKHDFNPMQKPSPVAEDGRRGLTKAVDPKGVKDIGGAGTSGTAGED